MTKCIDETYCKSFRCNTVLQGQRSEYAAMGIATFMYEGHFVRSIVRWTVTQQGRKLYSVSPFPGAWISRFESELLTVEVWNS